MPQNMDSITIIIIISVATEKNEQYVFSIFFESNESFQTCKSIGLLAT